MQDIEIKKEIVKIVKKNFSSLSKTDLPLLHGLNSILNDCTDRNGCKHDDLGRFTRKDNENNMQKNSVKEEIQKAINDIIVGKADEIIVKNIRDDLEQYGGSNDIAFIKGNNKGGVAHF